MLLFEFGMVKCFLLYFFALALGIANWTQSIRLHSFSVTLWKWNDGFDSNYILCWHRFWWSVCGVWAQPTYVRWLWWNQWWSRSIELASVSCWNSKVAANNHGECATTCWNWVLWKHFMLSHGLHQSKSYRIRQIEFNTNGMDAKTISFDFRWSIVDTLILLYFVNLANKRVFIDLQLGILEKSIYDSSV